MMLIWNKQVLGRFELLHLLQSLGSLLRFHFVSPSLELPPLGALAVQSCKLAANLTFHPGSNLCVAKSVRYEFVLPHSVCSEAAQVLIASSRVDIFNARAINGKRRLHCV